ncbi:MAG: hypothetical protein HFG86_03875 [Dorea sp.]|jgi:hypothetical protein|nr:hypothetical protein [Dorea sp.]
MKEIKILHEEMQQITQQYLDSPTPVYGMVIHEESDLNPQTRVKYLGKNQDFQPIKVDLANHSTDYGSWNNWPWLKDNLPVMCSWNGKIDYYLNPDNYNLKSGCSDPSDISNLEYEGNAMAVVRKIYTCTYCIGHDRYVYFCDAQICDAFEPVGFNVRGIIREYMLIPMFYGYKDSRGRLRSIAGQYSAGTITGHHSQNRDAIDMDTLAQYTAIQKSSAQSLFFGGALVNVLTDIAVMLSRTTDTQAAYGTGMSESFTSDSDLAGHWGTVPDPILNAQFYGGNNGQTYSNIFHSAVLGTNMLWQRDPYTLLIYGRLKVSPDYIFDLTGESYLDTGCDLPEGNYYATLQPIPGFGFIPCPDAVGSDSTGYCDHIYANPEVISIASRFGCSRSGARAGLFARSMNHSGFNRNSLNRVAELDESFSWWWNFGCSLLVPGPAA